MLATIAPGRPSRLRTAIRCYVEFFRGTPLLIQLFIVYAGGPHIGITLSAFTGRHLRAWPLWRRLFHRNLPCWLHEHSEWPDRGRPQFRLTRRHVVRHIVLPQMLLLVLPQIVNMLIVVLKDTAVAVDRDHP